MTASAHVAGETHDRRSIDLPAAQRTLATAILRMGKPVVIVLINGGSIALEARGNWNSGSPVDVQLVRATAWERFGETKLAAMYAGLQLKFHRCAPPGESEHAAAEVCTTLHA